MVYEQFYMVEKYVDGVGKNRPFKIPAIETGLLNGGR